MASGKHRLTALQVAKHKKQGYLSDGHGLYLKTRKSGSKTWAYIWTKKGKRTEISLGSAAGAQALSLAKARDEAEKIRQQIGNGLDPLAERNKEAPKTFLEVATILYEAMLPTWGTDKTAQQWRRSLFHDCKRIHKMPICSITDADCRKIVMPVWKRTPETGSRVRRRLERVFSYAEAHGMREGKNPARWEGHFREVLVGHEKREVEHLPSMPYAQVPEFMTRLKERKGVSALALEFTILTGVRSKEALQAVWSEIEFENALWTIPKERMLKNGKPHTIPLTPRVLEILKEMHEVRGSEYVFQGQKPNRPLSDMTMRMLMRRMGDDEYVPHGFRTSFRTWIGNETNTAREVAEVALSHLVGNAVEQAYSRGDALKKRRKLMPMWEDYCLGSPLSEVVRLHG